MSLSGASSVAINRCRVFGGHASGVLVIVAASGGADYNAGVVIADSLVKGARNGIVIQETGTTGVGGGVLVHRCTIDCGLAAFSVSAGTGVSSVLNSIDGCLIIAGTGLSGLAAGQIVDGGNNLIYAQTALSNVTATGGTITNGTYAMILHVGQEIAQGRRVRHFLTPTADSPALGFYAGSAGLVDLFNRPRPSGGGSVNLAAGAIELHDAATRETGTVPAGKANAIKWTGPIDIQLRVPVSAQATLISIQVQWDASYGAGTKPQLLLLGNNEIGVTGQTVTAAGSAGAWNTITLASFTPTGVGEVKLRLVSAAAAAGVVYWGDAQISAASATDDFDHFLNGEHVEYMVPGGSVGSGAGVSRSRQFIGD